MNERKKNSKLTGPGGCLTREAIGLFIDGLLSDVEKRKMLRHTRSCALCEESLEGAVLFSSGEQYFKGVKDLEQTLWRQKLNTRKAGRKWFAGVSSVAASIAILLGVFYVFEVKDIVENKNAILAEELVQPSQSLVDSFNYRKKNITEESNELMPQIQANPFIVEPVGSPDFSMDLFEMDEEMLLDLELDIGYGELTKVKLDKEYAFVELEAMSKSPVKSQENKKIDIEIKDASMNRLSFRDRMDNRKEKKKSLKKESYIVAEVMPVFQGGGLNQFNKYLADSLRVILPDSVLSKSILIGFSIDTAGSVNHVKLINGTSSKELNKDIVRLVRQSPMWTPAHQNGVAVVCDQEVEVVLNHQ